MARRSTVATRFSALTITLTLGIGVLACGAMLTTEFRALQSRQVNHYTALAKAEPQLARALYYETPRQVDRQLTEWIELGGLYQAQLFDRTGLSALQVIAEFPTDKETEEEQDSADAVEAPTFDQLRARIGPVSVASTWLPSPYRPGRQFDITVPIFTPVNPEQPRVDDSRFAKAMLEASSAGSLHVIGYLNVSVPGRFFIQQIQPYLIRLGLALLGCLVVVTLITRYFASRITAPLNKLARLAEDISSGRVAKSFRMDGSGEAREIAGLLHTIMSGLDSYKARMDVTKHLLTLKVEERTEQLSKRNEELSVAVEEADRAKEQLRQLAYFDSLTALPNRRLFTEQLSLMLRQARRKQGIVALLFLDLDNFKRINDTLGHSAGDQLLRKTAVRLMGSLRDGDVIAHNIENAERIDVSRLGGDEFTVVLNDLDSEESAGVVAQRILEALSKPMTIEQQEIVVTPSIGIALAPRDADSVEGLLKFADTAMYQAKSSGKNNYVYYDPEKASQGPAHLQMESDLRHALKTGELFLQYQPQVDIRTGSVVGAEALLRWNHPENGLIPPPQFIALAEEIGMIEELGDWTLHQACRQWRRLRRAGLTLEKLSVNISSLQLTPGFVDRVKFTLTETGTPADNLALEITEGVVVDQASETLDTLTSLRDSGVSLSIDDFGTGYSSLNYLSRLPLDELKIDRSFITALEQTAADASLVVAIIAMGRSMNMRLVAEGVETPEQYRFLKEQGVDIIQGYLFSPPVGAEALAQMLAPAHFAGQITTIEHIDKDSSTAQSA